MVLTEEEDLCRTCGVQYDDGGDGFYGECPDCADKTNNEEQIVCNRCGDITTISESPDAEFCPDCYHQKELDEMKQLEDEDGQAGVWFALGNDGLMYCIGHCGDFECAEEIAHDLNVNAVWIADEVTARQWQERLNQNLPPVILVDE